MGSTSMKTSTTGTATTSRGRSKSPLSRRKAVAEVKESSRPKAPASEDATEGGDSDIDSSASLKVTTEVVPNTTNNSTTRKKRSSSVKPVKKASAKSSTSEDDKDSSSKLKKSSKPTSSSSTSTLKRSSIKNLLTGGGSSKNIKTNNQKSLEESRQDSSISKEERASIVSVEVEATAAELESHTKFPITHGLNKIQRTSSRNSLDGIGFAEKMGLSVPKGKKKKKTKKRNKEEDDVPFHNKPGSDRISEFYMVSGSDVLTRPIAYVDLVYRINSARLRPGHVPKSIVSRRSADCKGSSKAVSFATDMASQKVWTVVKEFDSLDVSSRDVSDLLWWSDDDFDERYYQDQEVAALVREEYSPLLREAYKSTKDSRSTDAPLSPSMVSFDMEKAALCSMARGLEPEIIPKIRDLIVISHCRAILKLLQKTNDCEQICKASMKYSRPSRLMALKMGQFDALQAKSLAFSLVKGLR